ncbi:MAG TPA: hypothetical protein PKD64_09000 [Pirellulaceae bacterium]|nr:hypothetical protein [Pirellulaceae bacterium]
MSLTPGQHTNFQVETRMEVQGSLVLDPGEKTRTMPLDVQANYRYGERIASKSDQIKSVRHYETATSKIRLANNTTISKLGPENQFLIFERRQFSADGKRVRFQAPQARLTEPEYALVNTPGSSMLLTEWIKANNKKLDQSWATSDELLADILTWDYMEKNDVTAKIIAIEGSDVRIQIAGTAKGLIDGAACEATLQGHCLFNLQEGFVSHCRLKIVENRNACQVAPGFEATIWMESTISPAKQVKLTNAALSEMKMSPFSRVNQLYLACECGPYEFLYPRTWRLISNRTDRTVLRCIRDGIVLAQCDIIPMPNQASNTSATLEQFKTTVKRAVLSNGGEVIGGQQSPAIAQNQWLRVDAVGKSQDVPLRWIYYTITAPDSRRVQLLFTVEQEVYRDFQGLEQELVDLIEFQHTHVSNSPR